MTLLMVRFLALFVCVERTDVGFAGKAAEIARRRAIDAVGELELMMVDGEPFPFRIPRRYEEYVCD